MTRFLLLAAALLPTAAGAQNAPAEPVSLRHELRPGDHLVYREALEREIDNRRPYGLRNPPDRPYGEKAEITARAEWTAHLLVVGSPGDNPVVGMQRNRGRAELVRYRVDGRDRLEQGRAAFEERHRNTTVTGHATQVSTTGALRRPLSLGREWPSKVLWGVSEIVPLPAAPVRAGDRWTVDNPLGFAFRAVRWTTLGEESCLEVEGTATPDLLVPRSDGARDLLRIRYWFCPAAGLVYRLELTAEYPGANLEKITERLTFELTGRRRGEPIDAWLGNGETREAVLAAWLLDDALPVDSAALIALLAGADPRIDRPVLALAFRRGIGLSSAAIARRLDSPHPRVRTLAVRLLGRIAPDEAGPLLERAAADSDSFVRQAAREILQPAPPSLVSPDALGFCGIDSAWTALRIASTRRPPAPPGPALRGMATERYRGWPYIVSVPDDYLGDRPVPLLIYLAGNAGSAIEGMQIVHEWLDPTGYLVVYPNSGEWWWNDPAAAMVEALIEEVQRSFAVDARRIYLTGLSNGGSGAFYYSTLWPHRLTAAVSAMGAGVFLPGVDERDRPFAANTATLPLAFLHGEQDKVILPETTRRTLRLLGERRAPLETHFYPDLGHGIVIGRSDEGRTLAFLERFARQVPPRYVRFETYDLERIRRQYWLDVLERTAPAALAAAERMSSDARQVLAPLLKRDTVAVEGEISADNEIRLRTRGVERLRLLLRRDLLAPGRPVRVRVNDRQVFAGEAPPDCAVRDRSLRETADPFLAYDAELVVDVPEGR
ncbi:MAG TPA: dienelactone hydrolase family protein [Gemmatimonadales bacterium]|nr:dienelactone hydrolase family protein [Gemmatimonadales bacterium]